MEEYYIQQLKAYLSELVGMVSRIDNLLANPPKEDDAAKFEESRRNDVLRNLEKNMAAKGININTVVEWARLNENIIVQKLSPRNPKRKKTFWAVDVMKFLCDLWGVTPPDAYYKVCEKEGINPKTGRYEMSNKAA